MNFDVTVVEELLKELMEQDRMPLHHYELSFIIDGEALPPYRVESMDLTRNYIENKFDLRYITVSVPEDVLYLDLYPNRDQLYSTLRIKEDHPTDREVEPKLIYENHFKMTMQMEDVAKLAGKQQTKERDVWDKTNLATKTFQAIAISDEQLRELKLGMIFRDCNLSDAIRAIQHQAFDLIEVPPKQKIKGVDIAQGIEDKEFPCIIIPDYTRYRKSLDYLQSLYGVYKTGTNFYVQNQMSYVYPLWNTERFDSVEDGLVILNVPKGRYGGLDRTWLLKDKQLIIANSDDIATMDRNEEDQLNKGTGLWWPKASILKDPGEVKMNKMELDPDHNTMSVDFAQRRDNHSYVEKSPNGATRNTMKEFSSFAASLGRTAVVTWAYSKPDLIRPGMPAKIITMNDKEVTETNAVVVAVDTHYASVNNFNNDELGVWSRVYCKTKEVE